MALSAAMDGRGPALGSSLMVAEDIRSGRLVAPFPQSIAVSKRYAAACEASARHIPRIEAFVTWMENELARDSADFPEWFGTASRD